MEFYCTRLDPQFGRIKSTFHNSEIDQLQIKFKVSFHEIIYYYSILQQDLSTLEFTGVIAPYRKNVEVDIVGEVPAGSESLTWHDARDLVGNGIAADIDNRLPDNEMKEFLDHVEEEVCALFNTTGAVLPRRGVLSFECTILTGCNHAYHCDEVESDVGDNCMVPAAEWSFELLEICEDDEEEEGCCSICLDELSGGGGGGVALTLRMPCSHVFHGWCIQEWLRRSRYCPLCRYEMPVEEYVDGYEFIIS